MTGAKEKLSVGEEKMASAEREDGLRSGGRQARATWGRTPAPERIRRRADPLPPATRPQRPRRRAISSFMEWKANMY